MAHLSGVRPSGKTNFCAESVDPVGVALVGVAGADGPGLSAEYVRSSLRTTDGRGGLGDDSGDVGIDFDSPSHVKRFSD